MWRLVNKNIYEHIITQLLRLELPRAAATTSTRRRNDTWNLFSYDPVLFLSRLTFRSTSLYYFWFLFSVVFPSLLRLPAGFQPSPLFPFESLWNCAVNTSETKMSTWYSAKKKTGQNAVEKRRKTSGTHTSARAALKKRFEQKINYPSKKKKIKKKNNTFFKFIFLMHLLLPWELLETLSHRSLSLSLCMW